MKSSPKSPVALKGPNKVAQGKSAMADAALGSKPASASSPGGAKERLPKNWKVIPLGDVVQPSRPKVSPAKFPNLPFVGMEHVEAHTMRLVGTVPAGTLKSAAVHFEPGDVLYGRLRPYLNKVLSPDFEGLCSSEFIVFPHQETLNSKFLAFFLNSIEFMSFATHLNTGDRPRVDFSQISPYPFPRPPLDVQRLIVAEIEKQFTRLDAGVAALKRVQANLKRYRASVLKAACEGPWKWKPLADIAEIQGGVQKQPKRRPAKNHYPFLRVANVLRGRLDLSEVDRIELFGQELNRLRLQPGDLLIVEGNGSLSEIGRMAIWNGEIEDCVHQNHIIRARLAEDVLPKFASIYWNSPDGQRRITEVASSTSGLYTLSVRKVGRLELPVPSLAEQRRIVAQVEQRLSILGGLESALSNNLQRAARLSKSILHRAFEGRLVSMDLANGQMRNN